MPSSGFKFAQNLIDQFDFRAMNSSTMGTLTTQIESILNPWQFDWSIWILGFLGTRVAIAIYDHLVILLVQLTKQKLLPTRTGKPVRFVGLRFIDCVYLLINSVNEFVFVLNLCHYIWFSPEVPKAVGEVTVLNTVVALYLMFIVLDLFYAPAHRFLHWRVVYPYIHKHHHRQIFPVRGYLDAGNEHPIEHFIGTSCTWAAVWMAVHTTGAHALIIFFFFNIHAALAMLNHSPYDVDFSLLGMRYSVKAHELHHRCFTVNYSQYCMWWDHVMGTFLPYHTGKYVEEKSQ